MKLSFEDKESFAEGATSLCFNNPSSDPNTLQRTGSNTSSSMPTQPDDPDSERDEDICYNPPSDPPPNTLWRVGSSHSSIPPHERNGDIIPILNNLPNNPNRFRRMGSSSSSSSSSSMRSQERSEDT